MEGGPEARGVEEWPGQGGGRISRNFSIWWRSLSQTGSHCKADGQSRRKLLRSAICELNVNEERKKRKFFFCRKDGSSRNQLKPGIPEAVS